MPGVGIQRRLGRGLERWYYRHRAEIAVVAAFVVAGLLGLIAASMGLWDAA